MSAPALRAWSSSLRTHRIHIADDHVAHAAGGLDVRCAAVRGDDQLRARERPANVGWVGVTAERDDGVHGIRRGLTQPRNKPSGLQ